MEELLQNFSRLGMTDIAFLIVNSKKERSQEMFPMLDVRVSFPVYQETSEEEVWDILGGGKDDMFIYDRCGRLVAYVPFPLSMLDKTYITYSILYAYHDDPCDGMSCNYVENSTSPEDIENQDYTTYYLNTTDDRNYEKHNLTSGEEEIFPENEVNETWPNSNKKFHLQNNNTFLPQKDPFLGNDSNNETHNHYVPESTDRNLIWSIDVMYENNSDDNNTSTLNMPSPSLEYDSENKTACNNSGDCSPTKPSYSNDINELHDITPPVTTQGTPKRICQVEDEKLCQQWSKRHLKHIQKCCSYKDGVSEDRNTKTNKNKCKSFNQKRCKKLRTVVKCCLKIDTPDEENMEEFLPTRKQVTDSVEATVHNPDDGHTPLHEVP